MSQKIAYLTWMASTYPNYLANWPLNASVSIGEVGILKNGSFTQLSSLSNPGHKKSKSVNISQIRDAGIANESGKPLNPGETGSFVVSFNDNGGFVFQATDVTEVSIDNLADLKEQVTERIQSGDWHPNWYIIITVQLADVATALVAEGADAKINFVGELGTPLLLAGDAELQETSSSGDVTLALAAAYPTIMYKAIRIHQVWPHAMAMASDAVDESSVEVAEEIAPSAEEWSISEPSTEDMGVASDAVVEDENNEENVEIASAAEWSASESSPIILDVVPATLAEQLASLT